MGNPASDPVERYLGTADFAPVSQAHVMADTESLGEAGVAWLERMAALPADQLDRLSRSLKDVLHIMERIGKARACAPD